MLSGYSRTTHRLTEMLARSFAGGGKRKATRKDLDKYDLIIVGANLGGIFSRHIDHVTKGKLATMVCLDSNINQQYVMRNIYEQGRTTKTEYAPFAKMSISMFNAHSEGVGVDKFFPEQNEIQLKNGRKIKYDNLVLAMGMKDNFDSIKGFEDAWSDVEHPFFVARDYHTWRTTVNKPYRLHYNFRGGNAFFYIPPAPFHGEVECYNFFLSKYIWNWYNFNGKLSWDNTNFTVINANDRFVKYLDSADTYIKEELKKQKINVEYGLKLVEIKKNGQIAVFENLTTGEKTERHYKSFYSLIPAKPHENLVEAGLGAEDGFLNVDHQTLQHKKYSNIFGIGDVNSLPTTKTFFGGFQQVHVVRNNLEMKLKGLPLNGLYDGFAEAPLILGQDQLTWVQHYYNQKEGWQNLMGTSNRVLAWIMYHRFSKMTKKSFIGFYLFKSWGPPYGKVKKSFPKIKGAEPVKVDTKNLEPDHKGSH